MPGWVEVAIQQERRAENAHAIIQEKGVEFWKTLAYALGDCLEGYKIRCGHHPVKAALAADLDEARHRITVRRTFGSLSSVEVWLELEAEEIRYLHQPKGTVGAVSIGVDEREMLFLQDGDDQICTEKFTELVLRPFLFGQSETKPSRLAAA
jgi:hypothetical protein